MKTNNSTLLITMLAAVGVLGLSSAAYAQSDSGKDTKPKAKQAKPAPKQHKVWTEDDLGPRTPADAYLEAVQRQADKADEAAQAQAASEKQKVAGPARSNRSPLLSNPKTPADADRMIDWEKRDVEGQLDTLANLQKQIDETPDGERKDHLIKLFQEHQQILADTRKEMESLQADKAKLQKQSSSSRSSATGQPPSQ